MNNLNTVTLEGNLTRDPELRFTPSGAAIVSFGLAVNRSWQNRQTNAWEEATSFFDVTAWNQLAENVAESLTKGCSVIVAGRLEQDSWEDRNSGEKRSKIKVSATTIAASLRTATVSVHRNERRDAGAPPARSGAPAAAPAAGYGYDEEPF